MKNLITITALFISALVSAQVSPVVGVKYTGGLNYSLDHEYPSIEIGFYKNLSDRDYKLITGYYATVEFLYDNTALYSKQETGTKRDLEAHNAKFATILKVTNLKQIQGNLSLITILGGRIYQREISCANYQSRHWFNDERFTNKRWNYF